MATEHDFASVCRRLDALILLALESSPGGADSTTRKIERLIELGFSQPEIAQIISKKLNYVTSVISQKKGGARTKKATQPKETP